MKEIDKKILEELYLDIYREDYFKIDESNIDNFDWDKFFSSDYMGYKSTFLLEDFQKINDKHPTIEGNEDSYQITLRNGLTFMLYINYNTPDKTKTRVDYNILYADRKGKMNIVDNYKTYFKDLQPNEYMGVILFRDKRERTSMTGEVGYSAQELFVSLREAIQDSFFASDRIKDLRGFMIRITNEEKNTRLPLYTRMVKRYLKNYFPNIFIDDVIEEGITLLIATK